MIVLKISSILWLVLYFDPVRSSGKSYSQEPYWKWTSAGQLSQNKRGRSSATADTLHSNLDLWWSLYDAAFSAIRPYRRDSPIQWTSRPNNLDNVGAEETLELGKVFKLSHGPRRKRDSKWNAENEQKMFAVDPLFGIPIVVTKRPTSPMGTGKRRREVFSRKLKTWNFWREASRCRRTSYLRMSSKKRRNRNSCRNKIWEMASCMKMKLYRSNNPGDRIRQTIRGTRFNADATLKVPMGPRYFSKWFKFG